LIIQSYMAVVYKKAIGIKSTFLNGMILLCQST